MTPRLAPAAEARIDASCDVLIVGGGACGLIAGLAARDAGAEVIVVERDAEATGNTSWSVAMIPAADTRVQRAAGIDDSPERFAQDLANKTKGEADPEMIRRLAEQSGPTIDWLMQAHGLELELLTELLYPGHSRHRYHVPRPITGAALQTMLLRAAQRAGGRLLTGRRAETLYHDAARAIRAVGGSGSEGVEWTLGCGALVLATDGFGANAALVRQHIPAMADAIRYGHHGAQGDSLAWGEALGAATADLGAYQGHNVVYPQVLQLTWAVIIDGGVQVNAHGLRFANEMRGYSEQAADIVSQPGGAAWNVYDLRCERNAEQLDTYHEVQASGALVRVDSVEALARALDLPEPALATTLAQVRAWAAGAGRDPLGRDFTRTPPLAPPYVGVRVAGALYHTQGGLVVDGQARVVGRDGAAFPNLFAGGGAARGVSGSSAAGYLGGNGLLCAVVLGRIAGETAARSVRDCAA